MRGSAAAGDGRGAQVVRRRRRRAPASADAGKERERGRAEGISMVVATLRTLEGTHLGTNDNRARRFAVAVELDESAAVLRVTG